MDFFKYYKSQADHGMTGYGNYDDYYKGQALQTMPVFRGSSSMRGYGFGSVFKRFFRWLGPILKENALPIVTNIGKTAVKSAVNIANDTLNGQSFAESAKSNLKKSLNDLSDQYGSGPVLSVKTKRQRDKMIKKRRRSNSNNKKKRTLDIFD
jgi:hypothetical protein